MKYYGQITDPKDIATKEYTDNVSLSQDKQKTVLTSPSSTETYSYGNIFYGELGGTADAQTVTIEGITSYYEGLAVALKFNVATQHRATLNINNIGKAYLRYGADSTTTTSASTSYFPANYTQFFVYRSSDNSFRAIWSYYSDTINTFSALYDRRYTGANPLYSYKICGIDVNNKIQPLTLESGTGTSKTINTTPIDPNLFFYYNTSTTIQANSLIGANNLYMGAQVSVANYTFNAPVATYQALYLKGTLGSNGLFTLDNSTSTSMLVQVPENQTSITLSNYFETGYQYIYLGGSYSSTNYFCLELIHPMYIFDGTNLIPYIQSAQKATQDGNGNVIATTYATKTEIPANSDFDLSGLGDTAITNPANSQILQYNGTKWINANPQSFSQQQANWNETSTSSVQYIQNKPVNATQSVSGFMSNIDKTKLDGIQAGAQVNTVTGVKGNSETTYRVGNVNITATNIGLGNVNDTSDVNKPISSATQTALNLKANISSPALTGTPTAPTATAGTSTTQIATTSFVANAVSQVGGTTIIVSATQPTSQKDGDLWYQIV